MLKDIKKQNKKILSLLEQSESSTSSHHYLSSYKVCVIKASITMYVLTLFITYYGTDCEFTTCACTIMHGLLRRSILYGYSNTVKL